MKQITVNLYLLVWNSYLIGESRWSSILNPLADVGLKDHNYEIRESKENIAKNSNNIWVLRFTFKKGI